MSSLDVLDRVLLLLKEKPDPEDGTADTAAPLVSVIMPVYNAAAFLDETFESVVAQQFRGSIEVSAYDDGSEDASWLKLLHWKKKFERLGIQMVVSSRAHPPKGAPMGPVPARGAGTGRNRAVLQSRGQYLCLLDADDVMAPDRIQTQLDALAACPPYTICGANHVRVPAGSTPRYSDWLNSLSGSEVMEQRLRELTLIQPTWFMHRRVFDRVGGYSEDMRAPEDLLFFYKHIEQGGHLHKIDRVLLQYRYHTDSLSWRVSRHTLMRAKVDHLERHVLPSWPAFSIWNAGRDGKAVFKLLSAANQAKVTCFWDIDPSKIGTHYMLKTDKAKRKIPILHWGELTMPVIVCVASARGTAFEDCLAAAIARTGMQPGKDFFQMV